MDPYPAEYGHPAQQQTSFDPYNSRPIAPYSSHSASSSTLSSEDRHRTSLGHQHHSPQQHHQRQHHGHYQDQRHPDRMDMDVEMNPRSSNQLALSSFRRSSPPSALGSDPSPRSHQHPSTTAIHPHLSHGALTLPPTRTGYTDMHSQDNARGAYLPPPPPPPLSHPHHSSYLSSGGSALVDRGGEREREMEREPEHTSGSRGRIDQHPEESLHMLSSLAYHHQQQQQGWHHKQQSRLLSPSPTRDVGAHPHGPSGMANGVALTTTTTTGDSRHPPIVGSHNHNHALPLSRLEIKDLTYAADDAVDRALGHATALPTVSPTFEDDPGRRFSQSQYLYLSRPDRESSDHSYYDDLKKRREADRDADRQIFQQPQQPQQPNHQHHSQFDLQERHEQCAIAHPQQHQQPSDQRYMPPYHDHRQGSSYPSAPSNSSPHSSSPHSSSPHSSSYPNSLRSPQQHQYQQQQLQQQPHHQQYYQQQHQQQQHLQQHPPHPPQPQQPQPQPQPHQHQHQHQHQPNHGPSQEEGEKRLSVPRMRLPNLPRNSPNNQGGDNTHDSSYGSNADDDDDLRTFNLRDHDYRFKFGTDMPSTVDLKSAIESCDVLCRFALHYTNQANAVHDDGRGPSALDPEMRANLQKIRSMNMTMLIGLQNISKANEKSGPGGEGERVSHQDGDERETSPLRFGPGPPPHDMVHELAKVATSIFQLAIRIKAWVGMTPEERELDEDINSIRGKRCLLMDSTLAASTVDQHGNVQRDWTIVPAASSISKSFYERQREQELQRVANSSSNSSHKHSQQQQVHNRHDPPRPGSGDRECNRMSMDQDGSLIRRASSNSSLMSLSTQHAHSLNGTLPSSYSPDSIVSRSVYDHTNANGQRRGDDESRDSRDGDAPYQKYRKRAKRTQPPGRCLSCDSSDTPEWRRGPDGARTLCNACGLHYAKLLKRQGEQSQGPMNIKSRVTSSRMEQLQAISFPLRRRNGSQVAEGIMQPESGSSTIAATEAATEAEPGPGSSPASGSGSGSGPSSNQNAQQTGPSSSSSFGTENSLTQPSPTQPIPASTDGKAVALSASLEKEPTSEVKEDANQEQ